MLHIIAGGGGGAADGTYGVRCNETTGVQRSGVSWAGSETVQVPIQFFFPRNVRPFLILLGKAICVCRDFGGGGGGRGGRGQLVGLSGRSAQLLV